MSGPLLSLSTPPIMPEVSKCSLVLFKEKGEHLCGLRISIVLLVGDPLLLSLMHRDPVTGLDSGGRFDDGGHKSRQ